MQKLLCVCRQEGFSHMKKDIPKKFLDEYEARRNEFQDTLKQITALLIDIYNCERFSKYRRCMQEGRIGELEHCKDCTIPQSRSRKTNPHKMKTG